MGTWPTHPVIYEINTWVWLGELSQKYQRPIDLASVPAAEWDSIAAYSFDAVWLMGVWERSREGIAIAQRNEGLQEDFRRALPDFSAKDNVGSPYCVRRYVVDEHLGGPAGMAAARNAMSQRGLRLILDFVPNHVAPEHPWVAEHPEYFVRGDQEDQRRDPASFVTVAGQVLARGRDPFFPAWPDVIQINAFDPGLRSAVADTLGQIAQQCDGVRCDMAMLMISNVFERTWGARAGARPDEEYWINLIAAVRARHPEFRFLAEAYWGLEWELQQQGFDFCYDKTLYDRMEHGDPEIVRLHLLADMNYQLGMVRFLENHDEPRAAATFPTEKGRAAAVALMTLPGARLLHEGQFEGRKVRLPVFLGRRPEEPLDEHLAAFYRHLLAETSGEIFRNGEWRLCERTGWPDNTSHMNILAWCWEHGDDRQLIAINFSGAPAQANVRVPWEDVRGTSWRLRDPLSNEHFDRSGDELAGPGMFVSLDPWRWHFLQMTSLAGELSAREVGVAG